MIAMTPRCHRLGRPGGRDDTQVRPPWEVVGSRRHPMSHRLGKPAGAAPLPESPSRLFPQKRPPFHGTALLRRCGSGENASHASLLRLASRASHRPRVPCARRRQRHRRRVRGGLFVGVARPGRRRRRGRRRQLRDRRRRHDDRRKPGREQQQQQRRQRQVSRIRRQRRLQAGGRQRRRRPRGLRSHRPGRRLHVPLQRTAHRRPQRPPRRARRRARALTASPLRSFRRARSRFSPPAARAPPPAIARPTPSSSRSGCPFRPRASRSAARRGDASPRAFRRSPPSPTCSPKSTCGTGTLCAPCFNPTAADASAPTGACSLACDKPKDPPTILSCPYDGPPAHRPFHLPGLRAGVRRGTLRPVGADSGE